MPLAILVLALVAYGYALLSFPEFRRPGLIGGALVAAGLAVYFVRNPSEAELAATRIPAEQVVLDELTLERTPNGATLSGRVRNGSDRYRLRDVTLILRLRDCPASDTAPVLAAEAADPSARASPVSPESPLSPDTPARLKTLAPAGTVTVWVWVAEAVPIVAVSSQTAAPSSAGPNAMMTASATTNMCTHGRVRISNSSPRSLGTGGG